MGKDRLNNMGDGTHLDLSRRKVITRLLEDNKTAKDRKRYRDDYWS